MKKKLGLVLAGGGAKGAYEAGVLKYLGECGLKPDIIAGTSIGALNGAIIASGNDFESSTKHLYQLWDRLGEEKLLLPNNAGVANLLSKPALGIMSPLSRWVLKILRWSNIVNNDRYLFDPTPLERLLREVTSPAKLRQGIELWIAAFPSLNIPGVNYGIKMAMVDVLRGLTGTKAEWFRVQDCDDDDTLLNILLASAAIPIAFPRRKIGEQHYVDGALQDNVPLGALAKQGVSNVIVIHLGNASLWDRREFPSQSVIEIRPTDEMNEDKKLFFGEVKSLLDFSPQRISILRSRGYQDAEEIISKHARTFQAFRSLDTSTKHLIESTLELNQLDYQADEMDV